MSALFGLDNYFYHGSIRRYVALFGSLFKDVYIRRVADDGSKEEFIKVPIRYGNGNMYLKAPQDASREIKQIGRILPAMAFKLDNFYKDVSRKTNPMNRIQNPTFNAAGKRNYQFNRVPYSFLFELEIRTKNTDDMTQIVEQIVPAFDGNLSVTIQDTTGVDVEQDIIISVQEVTMEDNFDDEQQERLIEWKIVFELKGFIYKRTLTGIVVNEVDIQWGDSFDNITDQLSVTDQGTITEEQGVLSKLTEVVDGIASAPAD
jgi:hypothetical protein